MENASLILSTCNFDEIGGGISFCLVITLFITEACFVDKIKFEFIFVVTSRLLKKSFKKIKER